jgi:hypothetical protein
MHRGRGDRDVADQDYLGDVDQPRRRCRLVLNLDLQRFRLLANAGALRLHVERQSVVAADGERTWIDRAASGS